MVVLGIINYDYYTNNKGPILRLICRNKHQKRVILDLQDDKLMPHMYILKKDIDDFTYEVRNRGRLKLVQRVESGLPSALGEETVAIYTKYPWEIRMLRDCVSDILTFQADIKWEKMAVQILKLKQFIEVDKINQYGITELKYIHHTKEMFPVNQNICYWDIETNGSAVKTNWAHYSNAPKMPIISYVTYNKHKNEFIYYGWKPEWKPREEVREWNTEVMANVELPAKVSMKGVYRNKLIHHIRKKIILTRDLDKTLASLPEGVEPLRIKNVLETQRFKNYPRKSKLILKLFKEEVEMHKQFLLDFSLSDYDGLMTFNGRGGNRNLGGQRKWFNGFDLPIFYERCVYLGLQRELMQLSPFQYAVGWDGRILDPPVRVRSNFDDKGIETKHEIYIKGVTHHDLYFDSVLLEYTKYEYKMQRKNLDTFLQHFIGIGKIEHEGSVWDLFNKNWERELYYNIVDVEGMHALDVYFDYINDVSGRALLYVGKIEDSLYASKIHDHINLWFSNDKYVMDTKIYDRALRRMLRPNRWEGWIPGKVGGFNLKAISGIHKTGFIVDFSKLYPTCYMTSNTDVRTKIDVDFIERTTEGIFVIDRRGERYNINDLSRSPSGFWRKDILAQNSTIFKELIKERNVFARKADDYLEKYTNENNKQLKSDWLGLYNSYNARQFSYKVLINGKFGAEGNEGQRTFDYAVYNSAPSMGQDLIKFVLTWLERRGYKPLLASTDSALTSAKSDDPEEAWYEAQKLVKKLNKDLKEYVEWKYNPYEHAIKIGVEKIFDRLIIFDKRRYIMNTVIVEGKQGMIKLTKPKKYVKGLEAIRGDSALITKDMQDVMIDILTDGTQKDLVSYLQKVDKEFHHYPWAYICARASISNDINVGDASNAHYNACRNANKILGKNYDAGVRPLLGYFDKHPRKINGEYIPSGEFTMAFDEVDEFMLKKKGFDLNYQRIKDANVIKKVTPFIKMFNKGMRYQDVIARYDRASAIGR